MKTKEQKIKEIESVLNILKEEYFIVTNKADRNALTGAYRNLEKVKSYLEGIK